MDKTISASDANRRFSELLRAVRAGQTYVVTAHGRPIARLVPFSANEHAQPSARDALLKRLMAEPVTQAGRWSRDELYEDTD
jgi:prevent-host-death family protein